MLNWNNIDTVLLDMDGTLLDLHFDNYFWQTHLLNHYAQLHNISSTEAEAILSKKFKNTAGTQQWYCLDYWSNELSINILELKQQIKHLIAIHPHAESFLRTINGQKSLFIVTNAHRDSLDLKMECTNIAHYFDKLISSHDYQHPKEEVQFWHDLHSKLAFKPEKTLLVDDNLDVLRAAKVFGIQHLVAINYPDSKAAIKDTDEFIGVENFQALMPD